MAKKLIKLRFPGGMNNVAQETGLPENTKDTRGQARRIVNLDVADDGTLVTRPGIVRVVTCANAHSLWSSETGQTFYVDSGALYRLDNEMTSTLVRSGLNPGLNVSYCEVNGIVYWSNGQQNGKVIRGVDAEWNPGRAGSIVRYYNSRIYIVSGNFVYPTDASNYDSIDPFRNFFGLPESITLFEPVTGGIYAGCDGGVYFLSGSDYKTFSLTLADNAKPVPGSAVVVAADMFGATGKACAWLNKTGWVVGLPGGEVKPLSRSSLSIPEHTEAVSMFKEHGGLKQLVGIAKGGEQNIGISTDTYTTEVIRNGRLVI